MADIQPGKEFANRYVILTDFVPLLEQSYSSNGTTYCPLSPLSANGEIPTERFILDGMARDVRMIASISSGTGDAEFLELFADGKGLVMGPAEKICSAESRTVLKKRLGLQSVNDLGVIEFGRQPSLVWGLAMLAFGAVGFFGFAFLAMMQVGD